MIESAQDVAKAIKLPSGPDLLDDLKIISEAYYSRLKEKEIGLDVEYNSALFLEPYHELWSSSNIFSDLACVGTESEF